MQSPSPPIAKACVLPVCNNQRFHLVHKFPADRDRFAEWLEVTQRHKPIEKFIGESADVIRKRFFICSRHFSPREYKNVESRSLNLTAVPHLNLNDLNELHLSKAWQLENISNDRADDKRSSTEPSPALKILNQSLQPNGVPKDVEVLKRTFKVVRTKVGSDSKASTIRALTAEPPAKKTKQTPLLREETLDNLLDEHQYEPEIIKESLASIEKAATDIKTEVIPEASQEIKHETKLLALIEVTPEQYEKLSKSLSSSERNENISSLLNFMTNDEDERISAADNGKKSVINPFYARSTFLFTFIILVSDNQHGFRARYNFG